MFPWLSVISKPYSGTYPSLLFTYTVAVNSMVAWSFTSSPFGDKYCVPDVTGGIEGTSGCPPAYNPTPRLINKTSPINNVLRIRSPFLSSLLNCNQKFRNLRITQTSVLSSHYKE